MRITKRRLRKIIREALIRDLIEQQTQPGYMVPRFETSEDMFLFLDELEPEEQVNADVIDPETGETVMYAGESPAEAGLKELEAAEEETDPDELDHYDWDAYERQREAEEREAREKEERIQNEVTDQAVAAGVDWARDTLYQAKNDPKMWQGDMNRYNTPEEYVMGFGQDAAADMADSFLTYSMEKEVVDWFNSLPVREDEWARGWGASRPTQQIMKDIVADYFYDGVNKAIETAAKEAA